MHNLSIFEKGKKNTFSGEHLKACLPYLNILLLAQVLNLDNHSSPLYKSNL